MTALKNALRSAIRNFSWQSQWMVLVFLTSTCLLVSKANSQEIRRALAVAGNPGPPPTSLSSSSSQPRFSMDEQAKFLAGIPLPKQSGLSALQAAPFYREHTRLFSETWSRFQKTHFIKMRSWSQTELQPKLPQASVLLYMFGGPDFINAFALFPNIPTMVLCGLEPIGHLVSPTQLEDTRLARVLAALRTATDSTLKWSFFISKDMKVDLRREDFKGVLPILSTFLALSGNFIERTEFIQVGGFPAVRMTYRKTRSSSRQILYYVNGNLVNGSSKTLLSWLSSLGPSIGYLKAASYLMHQEGFSSIRNFLLHHCLAILQDDSGVPYRYFSPDHWQVYLYGKYTRPIDLFQSRYQDNLHNAYKNSGTVEFLPFGTGYRWRPGESNLMLAIQKR